MPNCPKCGSSNTYFEGKVVFIIMAVYKCNNCGNEFLINGLSDWFFQEQKNHLNKYNI